MLKQARDIVDEAIAWNLRQLEMSEAEWQAFAAWLEADPAHADAFDRVVLEDRLLDEVPLLAVPVEIAPLPVAANDDPAPPAHIKHKPWLWSIGGGAIAAALAIALVPNAGKGPQGFTITTQPGETRDVKLPDGTTVAMSGGTTLRLDHGDPRFAALDSGEATFRVHHDGARPFTVHAGNDVVQDVGTVFNLARDRDRLEVQVAEGAVMFAPGINGVLLKAGQALTAQGSTVTRSDVPADSVGGWRQGQVSYSGQPLGSVIAAVTRYEGVKITLSSGLSAQPFTGMVRLSGVAAKDVPHLAALVGATWRRDGETYALSLPGETAR